MDKLESPLGAGVIPLVEELVIVSGTSEADGQADTIPLPTSEAVADYAADMPDQLACGVASIYRVVVLRGHG
jgi:hypothetical protein